MWVKFFIKGNTINVNALEHTHQAIYLIFARANKQQYQHTKEKENVNWKGQTEIQQTNILSPNDLDSIENIKKPNNNWILHSLSYFGLSHKAIINSIERPK